MAENFKIEDYSKIIKKFEELSEKVQKTHAFGAARRGAQVIANNIQKSALRVDSSLTPEQISKNVGVQRASKISKKEKAAAYRIGIYGGAKDNPKNEGNPGGNTFHWRFLEFGTEHMEAKPFFRDAFESSGPEAAKAIGDSLKKRIEKEAKKK